MKAILFCILLVLSALTANAEVVEIANFTDGFGQERSVKMILADGKPKTIFFPCEKEDGSLAFIYQPIDYVFMLESYLTEICEKYIEWTKVAMANGVEEYEKELPSSGYPCGFYWQNPDPRYGASALKAVWKYGPDKNMMEVKAKVWDCNGSYENANFVLKLPCLLDINSLLEAISESNIKAHTPKSVDDLFK